MRIVILSTTDFASSAWRIVEAVRQVSDIDIKLIKAQSYKFQVFASSDMVLSDPSSDSRIVKDWVSSANIIHYKGDEIIPLDWYNIQIPSYARIIHSVGGSSFRKPKGNNRTVGRRVEGDAFSSSINEYKSRSVLISALTPDINYPENNGYYTQHAINSSVHRNKWKYDKNIVIAHSPSNRKAKGTVIFLKAMEILVGMGYDFSVDVIENVSNEECVRRKSVATIFFDQITTGFYGMSALEAMQFGIPTVCYISDEAIKQSDNKLSRATLPVINVEPTVESIVLTFQKLLSKNNKSILKEISKATKQFVDEFHSYEVVGTMWAEIYKRALQQYPDWKGIKIKSLEEVKNTLTGVSDEEVPEKEELVENIIFKARENSDNFAIPYLSKLKHTKGISESKQEGFIWVEWGSSFAEDYLKTAKKNPVLVRIHDWEVSSGVVKKINWENVDLLWFINKQTRADFFNLMPHLNGKPAMFLPNAVRTEQFEIAKNKKYGKHIVAISVSFKDRKRYNRLIEIFKLVYEQDNEWKLTIKAQIVDDNSQVEYNKLLNRIKSYGLTNVVELYTKKWDFKDISDKSDMNRFLADKDILVSSSDHEGFHYSIAEASLCGLYPVVYNWEWGRPKDFWGGFVVESEQEAANKIIKWGKLSNRKKTRLSIEAREYVESRYSAGILANKLKNRLFANKKVLVVAHNHPVRFNPRGAEKSLKIIIDQLKGLRYDVSVAVRCTKTKISDAMIHDGVKYHTIASSHKIGGDNFKSVLKGIVENDRPDLVLTWATAAPETTKLCIEENIPYILLIRWFRLIQPLPLGDLMSREIDKDFVSKNKYMFENAKSVITNNYYSTQIIKRIYNVVSKYSFVPYFSYQTSHIGGNINGHILLITPEKDLMEKEMLDRISKLLPGQKFLAVNAKTPFVSGNLEFKGYVADMDRVFKNTKILLYIDYKNDVCGTSRVAIEAMSYGIPVLCNDRSGLSEVIPNTVSRDATPSEWADKITEIGVDYTNKSSKALDVYKKYDSYSQLGIIIEEIDRAIL